MPNVAPFSALGANVAVTAGNGASSGSTTLPGSGGHSAKIYNSGTFPVVVKFSTAVGGATVGAQTDGQVFAAGLTEIVSIPDGTTDVACWGIGGAPVVYIQRGEGS
jgi:hypothetical protein